MSSLGFDDDYEVGFTLGADPAGTDWVAGLGMTESGPDWRDIEYGLRSSAGVLNVRENGAWRKGGAALAAGDVISLLVSNGAIEYRHNGVPIHTSTYQGAPGFYIDTAFRTGAMALDVSVARCVTPACLAQ